MVNSFFYLHSIPLIFLQQEVNKRSIQSNLSYSIRSAGDAMYGRQYSPLVQVKAIAIAEDMQT